MTYEQLKADISAQTSPVLIELYYSHLQALTDYIDVLKAKLDTIDSGAKVPLTPDEVIGKINTAIDKIALSHINIPDSSFTIAQTSGLAAAIAAKAETSHTHTQSQVTDLVSDLAGKAPTVHIHALESITDLTTELAGKALAVHKHNHTDCIENGSGTAHDDHSWGLSRIKQGAPSDSNTLETQITYKAGVAPAAPQDVARMQDILNAINGKYSKTVTTTIPSEEYIDVAHNLDSNSFIVSARINYGSGFESANVTINYTDTNNFRIFFGSGVAGLPCEYSWIWAENSEPPVTPTTEIPVYLLPATNDGTIPANGKVQVFQYLESTNFTVEGWVDYGTGKLEKASINVTVDDGNSFTADFGSGMSGLTYKLTWIKKLV